MNENFEKNKAEVDKLLEDIRLLSLGWGTKLDMSLSDEIMINNMTFEEFINEISQYLPGEQNNETELFSDLIYIFCMFLHCFTRKDDSVFLSFHTLFRCFIYEEEQATIFELLLSQEEIGDSIKFLSKNEYTFYQSAMRRFEIIQSKYPFGIAVETKDIFVKAIQEYLFDKIGDKLDEEHFEKINSYLYIAKESLL